MDKLVVSCRVYVDSQWCSSRACPVRTTEGNNHMAPAIYMSIITRLTPQTTIVNPSTTEPGWEQFIPHYLWNPTEKRDYLVFSPLASEISLSSGLLTHIYRFP
ncbi:hypothetical protein RRG08_046911 [Elysia crispata]|uniref:Uncharacterized protein n=1 Tax=Elysia crispata TaxID=231223 RepID=A0AAE0ZJ02_9GAST|nr:hypothetical protein RRG08_046911 [Elysia crispata]